MTIQILGTGCAKCKQLTENAEAAARALGIDCPLEKVSDILKVIECGVLVKPALAVDGKVKLAGKLATAAGIRERLQ